MIFTFLISIVFIAELIITFAILNVLFKLDKMLLETNETVIKAKPEIKDIANLAKLISSQLIEFAENFRDNVKKEEEKFAVNILSKILITLVLLKINSKTVRKIRKSKVFKNIKLGFNLLQNVV